MASLRNCWILVELGPTRTLTEHNLIDLYSRISQVLLLINGMEVLNSRILKSSLTNEVSGGQRSLFVRVLGYFVYVLLHTSHDTTSCVFDIVSNIPFCAKGRTTTGEESVFTILNQRKWFLLRFVLWIMGEMLSMALGQD